MRQPAHRRKVDTGPPWAIAAIPGSGIGITDTEVPNWSGAVRGASPCLVSSLAPPRPDVDPIGGVLDTHFQPRPSWW